MSITRKMATVAVIGLMGATASTAALAVSKRTTAAANKDITQLLRMMDRDMNGSVSKEEFMQFMSETFDRLDVNHSGALERSELQRMTIPNWLIRQQQYQPG